MVYIDTMLLPIRYMYSIIQSIALIGIQNKQFDMFFLPTKYFFGLMYLASLPPGKVTCKSNSIVRINIDLALLKHSKDGMT